MQAVGTANMLPSGVKRPALVDSKTGMPVYQPLPNTASPYPQIVPLQTAQPRFVTLGSGVLKHIYCSISVTFFMYWGLLGIFYFDAI